MKVKKGNLMPKPIIGQKIKNNKGEIFEVRMCDCNGNLQAVPPYCGAHLYGIDGVFIINSYYVMERDMEGGLMIIFSRSFRRKSNVSSLQFYVEVLDFDFSCHNKYCRSYNEILLNSITRDINI